MNEVNAPGYALQDRSESLAWQHALHEERVLNERAGLFLVAEAMLLVFYATIAPLLSVLALVSLSVVGLLMTALWTILNMRQSEDLTSACSTLQRVSEFYREYVETRDARGVFRKWDRPILGFALPGIVAVVWLVLLLTKIGFLSPATAEPGAEGAGRVPEVTREDDLLVGVVGPFSLGEACVFPPVIEKQVSAIVGAVAAIPATKRILVVSASDAVPIGTSASHGNNTGLALARGRCTAGLLSELLAQRGVALAVDVRVRSPRERQGDVRFTGADSDRTVEVHVFTPYGSRSGP